MSAEFVRKDGRGPEDLRRVEFAPNFITNAEGSVLVTLGETRVICTATVEDKVPRFLRNGGQGWITSEYGMIPRATNTRTLRESTRGRISGRTHEIQRLIGRSLRAVARLPVLGERTVWLDCDVIQADGGTRTASITGAFVALVLALNHLREVGAIKEPPLSGMVAATSVGLVDGQILLDLSYEEDSVAEVDMNIVQTDAGAYVELQGTAEKTPFSRAQMESILRMAGRGIESLLDRQREVLGKILPELIAGSPKSGPA